MGSNAMAFCPLVLLFQGRAGEWNSPPSCPLARIFHKLAGFFTSGTVLEEKSGWTALVFRFRRNLILIVL